MTVQINTSCLFRVHLPEHTFLFITFEKNSATTFLVLTKHAAKIMEACSLLSGLLNKYQICKQSFFSNPTVELEVEISCKNRKQHENANLYYEYGNRDFDSCE